MTEPALLELINAEIDRELDVKQVAELARGLLGDPDARALRDELRRVCAALDAIADVEPPPELKEDILAALPHTRPLQPRSWWSASVWRYAAVFASVLVAGTVLYQTVHAPGPVTTEGAGTMASHAPVIVDSAQLGDSPVSGRVNLYRDGNGLRLEFRVVASRHVDAVVSDSGHTLTVTGLGRQEGPGMPQTVVALPGFNEGAVKVTFLMEGTQVGSVALRVPEGR